MKLADLDAVTLDAYGTLVTLADPVPELMNVLSERGVERSEQAVLAGFRTEVAHYAPRASEGHDEASLARLQRECAVFSERSARNSTLTSSPPPMSARSISRSCRECSGRSSACVRSASSWRSWRTGTSACNGYSARPGFAPYFRIVVHAARKPAPDGLLRALGKLQVDPARALHIGDDDADRDAAAAAGMQFERTVPAAVSHDPVKPPLALWSTFVAAFATLSYTLRFTSGKPPKDLLYKWSTAAGTLIQFAIIAAIVYGIPGITGERRRVLALRRPTSWRTAIKIGIGVGIGIFVLSLLLSPLLHPDREQGVTPDTWEPKHAAAYIVNGIVIAVVAPIVEELTFRGLGYSLLARYGRWVAIIGTGLAFALAHGLVDAFPILAAFGFGLAYLRSRVDSVYPGMIVHGLFNAVALTVAVSGKPQADILGACAAVWPALSSF